MASQIKHKIAKNFYEALHSKVNTGHYSDFLSSLRLVRNKVEKAIYSVVVQDTSLESEFFRNSQKELLEKGTVKNVTLDNDFASCRVQVEVEMKQFIKDVLDSDTTKLNFEATPKKIIVEFSSPNIAKPFHMGHLRSTIIGNSLANIKRKFGNDVVKLNFLGDWGTQFGMIQLGMKLENYSEDNLKENPLEVLLKAYVKGNTEAEKNSELYEEAKKIFSSLENGNEEITAQWTKCRNYTLESLSAVYKRLGIEFDEYSWESDYSRQKAGNILKALEEQGILSVDHKNRKVAVFDNCKIPLVKSDDSTLYILRDLMAVKDRRSRHKFDEMYYVVDNGQSEHFTFLMRLCSKLNLDEDIKMEHVKFGKVRGMSTRKGRIVLLSDVLDEARERIHERQSRSTTTKAALSDTETTDILGVSTILVNDLKQRRTKDYDFTWENSTQIKGDTGPAIQYCHARLCNLEIESGATAATECDPEALMDSDAVNLILTLARYEETLCCANARLEPCILLKYLFDLIKAINSAYARLKVKSSDPHVSSQRLLLFNKSRAVLNEGMRLLGMKPVSKM